MFITNIYSKKMFNIVFTIIRQHYQTDDQNILVKFLSFVRKEKQIFLSLDLLLKHIPLKAYCMS